MNKFKLIPTAGFSLFNIIALYASPAHAETYYWKHNFGHIADTPYAACEKAAAAVVAGNPNYLGYAWTKFYKAAEGHYNCNFIFTEKTMFGSGITLVPWSGGAFRYGDSCASGSRYIDSNGACESPDVVAPRKELGPPTQSFECRIPGKGVGNPVNISTGNKYQIIDNLFPAGSSIPFSASYNSGTGLWRHAYSDWLEIATQTILLHTAEGKGLLFYRTPDRQVAESAEGGLLQRQGSSWVHIGRDDVVDTFNDRGELIRRQLPSGLTLDVLSVSDAITVSDTVSGSSLNIVQDSIYQPISAKLGEQSVNFSYDIYKRMVSVKRKTLNVQDEKKYLYENTAFPKLLTGVTDESGTRYATWAYDDQARATLSEHANGAERVQISYHSDGSKTLTNEYGKKTLYKFKVIKGENYITSIEGEASPNCSYSNSEFVYDDNGLLKTRKDANGNLTTYEYNDRGLEISRTEASGTPQARTITTEWHPTLFLKTKVTEPNRITTYQYDAQGRPLGQTVTPR